MHNPFRTEEEAFKFVWLTILYSALIVAGSFINVWVGLGVFVAETALIAWWVFARGRRERPIPHAPPPHPEGERRILVVALRGCARARARRRAGAQLATADVDLG